jgi:hypothetical protein
MSEEILINVTPMECRVALVENGVVQELFVERTARRGLVGNIYKGVWCACCRACRRPLWKSACHAPPSFMPMISSGRKRDGERERAGIDYRSAA